MIIIVSTTTVLYKFCREYVVISLLKYSKFMVLSILHSLDPDGIHHPIPYEEQILIHISTPTTGLTVGV